MTFDMLQTHQNPIKCFRQYRHAWITNSQWSRIKNHHVWIWDECIFITTFTDTAWSYLMLITPPHDYMWSVYSSDENNNACCIIKLWATSGSCIALYGYAAFAIIYAYYAFERESGNVTIIFAGRAVRFH